MLKLFTFKEAIIELRMSRSWMIQKIKEGKINVTRLGKKMFFAADEIERIKKDGV